MIDEDEIGRLQHSQATKQSVQITVTGCAYSCCGKGWQRRDGYEQTYVGWIDNLDIEDGPAGIVGTFMLYSAGIGTLSYVVAVRVSEVEAVDELGPIGCV